MYHFHAFRVEIYSVIERHGKSTQKMLLQMQLEIVVCCV